MSEFERVTLTEEQLFERLVELETQALILKDDIKQLKADAKFHKDENPGGIAKEVISDIAGAAKLHAKNDFEEKKAKADSVFQKYVELTGYDDK